MNYEELAEEFLSVMSAFVKNGSQRRVNGFAHGRNYMLYYLHRRGGNVLPSEISSEMGITTARTAAALKNLESKGLLRREIDQNDRRQILVTLTEEGIRAAQIQEREFIDMAKHTFAFLGEADSKELLRIVKKLQSCHEGSAAKDRPHITEKEQRHD